MTRLYDPADYTVRPDGSAFSVHGGYSISPELWTQRMVEGRSQWARHDFVYEDRPPESHGQGWYTQYVKCQRCGEERSIGISVYELNRTERWCIASRGSAPLPFGPELQVALLILIPLAVGFAFLAALAALS